MKLNLLGPACLVAGALAFFGCGPPKYVNYWSQWRDWRASVPWGWNIATESDGDSFANTNLVGPFAPDFYHGVPTFSVRWHKYKSSHRLPDGLPEFYRDADDYVKQTLAVVYAGNYDLVCDMVQQHDRAICEDPKRPGIPKTPGAMTSIYIEGHLAKHFTVLAPVDVPPETPYGALFDKKTGKATLVRLHEYVVLPLETGFYVIIYPATREGFDVFKPQFNNFLNTFHIAKEGPGAPTPAAAAPAAPMATKSKVRALP